MSKPTNIFIVRHGRSAANEDRQVFSHTPDYAVRLTTVGHEQALGAGHRIAKLATGPLYCWYSPYFRTRDTLLDIAHNCKIHRAIEDPRIREQEWGTVLRVPSDNIETERDNYGHCYYRIDNGESCADAFDRVSDFIGSMWREFEKPTFPNDVLIVTHGMTMRVFLMRWLHLSVEQFELLANPDNCGIYHLQLDRDTDRYHLVGEPKLYPGVRHQFAYDKIASLQVLANPDR